MTENTPDPIEAVLHSDHEAITRDLAGLRSAGADPGELFTRVTADIVRHLVAEEQYLLPAVREHLAGGERLAGDEFADHQRIEAMLRRLDDIDDDSDNQRVGSAVDALTDAMREHVRRQESELIPALVEKLDTATRNALGEGALGAEQLAPTHPRAFVPKSATLNKIASWLEGLVDKSLDSR